MILSDWVRMDPADPASEAWDHVIFDFNHPDSTMKQRFRSNDMSIVISGDAWAYGANGTRGSLQYTSLGLASIDVTYTDGVWVPGGDYRDVAFRTDTSPEGAGTGTITVQGVTYGWRATADEGLLLQTGDRDGAGHRRGGHQAYFDALNLDGRFSVATGGAGGSAGLAPNTLTNGEERGGTAGWGGGDSDDDRVLDFLMVLKGRGGVNG